MVWLLMVGIFIIDRMIKVYIQGNFTLGESVIIVPDFFHLTYVLNPGAAFGLMAGRTWIFIVTATTIVAGIIYAQMKIPREEILMRYSLSVVAGGALGNLYDRVTTGMVIDYLDFRIWSYVFNFADSMIVVGVGLQLIMLYLKDREEERGT